MGAHVKIKDLKVKDKVVCEGKVMSVEKIEFSNIGKHGKSKARIELKDEKGEKKVLIRPADSSMEKA